MSLTFAGSAGDEVEVGGARAKNPRTEGKWPCRS